MRVGIGGGGIGSVGMGRGGGEGMGVAVRRSREKAGWISNIVGEDGPARERWWEMVESSSGGTIAEMLCYCQLGN